MRDGHDEWEDSLLVHLMKWAKKETNEDGCEEWEDLVGLANGGKDIVFRFIIRYSSLREFGP